MIRWKQAIWSVGLLLAGITLQAGATHPTAPPVLAAPAPSVSTHGGPVYSQPLPGGCRTPAIPGTIIVPPGTSLPPSTPGTLPPSTTPGSDPAVPGAAAAGAGATSAIGGGGGEGGSDSLASATPNMIGDLVSRGVIRTSTTVSYGVEVAGGRPLAAAGAFKIAENESPRPVDRVFITYSYFNNINSFGGARVGDIHRQVIGFEKTFLDGDASLGMRLPFLQRANGDGASNIDGVGDLSVIFKYAFLNDRMTGDILSGGLVVTTPTGNSQILADGTNIHNVLLQPWAGFILNSDRFFVQGFSALIVPVESRDATLWSNDIGVGYWLYQNPGAGALTAIIPTVEAHLTTPLSNRGVGQGFNGLLGYPDQLVLTGGVHFGLWDRAYLTVAGSTPVVGPRLFDFEATVLFNVAF